MLVRIKRTWPSFLASKTEWETSTKTSVLRSSKNRKIRGNGENRTLVSLFDFFRYFRRPPQFGHEYPEYQFFTGFRMSYVAFQSEFQHKKSSLVRKDYVEIQIEAQHRVKRTSPAFSASKTERETITKTSVLRSSKSRKIQEKGENYTLF